MSRDFGGSGNYLSVADGSAFNLATWTYSVWVYLDTRVQLGSIFNHQLTTNMPIVLSMGSGGSEGMLDRWYTGFWNGGWQTISDSASAPLSTWVHLAGTYDGTTVRFYRDGTERNNGAKSGIANSSAGDDFYIGREWAGNIHPDGRLAEAAIWSGALSAGEIAALAKGLSPRLMRPNTIKMYLPIYGSGSPEPDLSGNGQNFTVNGTLAVGAYPPVMGNVLPSVWGADLIVQPSITVGFIASSTSVFAPTLSPQPVNLSLGFISATTNVFAPTLTPLTAVPFISSSTSLFAMTLTASGTATMSLGFIASTTTLHAPVIAPPAFDWEGISIGIGQTFQNPFITWTRIDA